MERLLKWEVNNITRKNGLQLEHPQVLILDGLFRELVRFQLLQLNLIAPHITYSNQVLTMPQEIELFLEIVCLWLLNLVLLKALTITQLVGIWKLFAKAVLLDQRSVLAAIHFGLQDLLMSEDPKFN